MKKSSTLLIAVALILSACGTMTQLASTGNGQTYQDGIYSNTPAFRTRASKETAKASTDSLAEATKASMIYLFGEKKDTVMIPENMSAMIRFDQQMGGTVVTVGENPYDWRYDLENNYGYYYGPYSIGSSWYWSRHYSPWATGSWYYGTGYYSPWRYSWHDPWYYGSYAGWYDPWYMGWYDPWYYGGWYSAWDPWYRHNYWHNYYYYAGWYGGWDPYWGHHHHHHHHGIIADHHYKDRWYGTRGTTGADRVFTSGTSLRGGIGSRSTVSRNETAAADRTATTRGGSSTGRTTAARRVSQTGQAASSSMVQRSTVARTAPGTRDSKVTTSKPSSSGATSSTGRVASPSRPVTTPSGTAASGSSVSRGSASGNYRRPATSGSSTTYERNDESRSSSSYSRSSSSTSSTSRSSYTPSTSTPSRSSYSPSSGGGGYSRSGGSSGGGATRSGGAVRR